MITTEEKILLARQKIQDLLMILGSSGPVVSKLPEPVNQVLDLLDYAVVLAKYAELDLEATKREREYFRNLESNQG